MWPRPGGHCHLCHLGGPCHLWSWEDVVTCRAGRTLSPMELGGHCHLCQLLEDVVTCGTRRTLSPVPGAEGRGCPLECTFLLRAGKGAAGIVPGQEELWELAVDSRSDFGDGVCWEQNPKSAPCVFPAATEHSHRTTFVHWCWEKGSPRNGTVSTEFQKFQSSLWSLIPSSTWKVHQEFL